MLADAGNALDALFMAARAALWDTKVPRTRPIQYQGRRGGGANEDAMEAEGDPAAGARSAFDTRDMKRDAADFELPDYWDEGEVLDGRDRWPVCVTLNLVGDLSSSGICCSYSHRGRRFTASANTFLGCDFVGGRFRTCQTIVDVLLPVKSAHESASYAHDRIGRALAGADEVPLSCKIHLNVCCASLIPTN